MIARSIPAASVVIALAGSGQVAGAQFTLPSDFPIRQLSTTAVTDSSTLNRPIGGELALDGSVVVVDLGDARVHVFSPQGHLTLSVGRRGGGPGEFAAPTRAVLMKNGDLIVYDQANRQFSLFSASGAFIERKVLDTDFRTIDNIIALPDGNIAVAGVSNDPRYMNSAIHVFNSQFAHIRSFGELPAYTSSETLWRVGVGSISLTSEGNILFTRRAPFQILTFAPDGHVLSSIAPPLESIATLDEAVVAQSDQSRTILSTSSATLPTRAFLLPTGMILTGRVSRTTRQWHVLDMNGSIRWSGRAPGDLTTQIIGIDAIRNVIWVLGVTNDVPVLYRLALAK